MQPPPKRFESPWDTRFDPIRHLGWFKRLEKRRAKLPMLEQAAQRVYVHGDQKVAAESFGVDERELRDYIKFKDGRPKVRDKNWQEALDSAYRQYGNNRGALPFGTILEYNAKRFGINPRHLRELWETDRWFLPSGLSCNEK